MRIKVINKSKHSLPQYSEEAQIRPINGRVIKNGITILNPPGTTDDDYRGDGGFGHTGKK